MAVIAVGVATTIVLGVPVVCATTLALGLAAPVRRHRLKWHCSHVTATVSARLDA